MTGPRVGIGMTLYNRAGYLREALESLRSQTCQDFRLVLVDDGSRDDTERIAREYAAKDPRVTYVRNANRVGMIAAWRQAFELACQPPTANPQPPGNGVVGSWELGVGRFLHGPPDYFAWASDHDRWHPDWLRTLVDTLDQHPEVVMAYPITQRVDGEGRASEKPAREFETFGVGDVRRRWQRFSASASIGAGDMVYGLMRTSAVAAAGIFRPVLCPDRLLMAELTLRGEIRQVPHVLWFRRQFSTGSVERQRQTLFAPGAPPISRFATPWWMHARALWAVYGGEAGAALGLSRGMIVRYAGAYALRHYAKSDVQRGVLAVLGWPRWMYKRVKHAVLAAVYHVLVTGRRILAVGPPEGGPHEKRQG